MSGIVGSYFNTRGSGVVAKLGTDGQVFTSTGAGLSQGFEAAAGGGKIGQVVQTVNLDEETIASTTFAAITDFSVAITPAATSSKILIMGYMMIGSPNTTQMINIQLFRDTTQIFMGADAEPLRTTAAGYMYQAHPRGWWQISPIYLDSPSTTSEVAYTFKWRGEGTASFYLNRTHNNHNVGGGDGVYSYDSRPASSITVMEVLA